MSDTIVVEQSDNLIVVETSSVEILVSAAGERGLPGVSGATFSQAGMLSTVIGTGRYYMAQSGTLTDVIASVGTVPTGANVVLHINKNGTNIGTVTIVAGSHMTQTSPNVNYSAGDYFTIDIVQVGSTFAGSNLVVQLIYV